MNLQEKLNKISHFLFENTVQYSHFIHGVYIVQVKENSRFSPIFLKWVDDNEIEAVYLSSVLDNVVYSIVVKED